MVKENIKKSIGKAREKQPAYERLKKQKRVFERGENE